MNAWMLIWICILYIITLQKGEFPYFHQDMVCIGNNFFVCLTGNFLPFLTKNYDFIFHSKLNFSSCIFHSILPYQTTFR